MKNVFISMFAMFILGISVSSVIAQVETPQPTPNGVQNDKPNRPRLMEELGLSKDQAQQLRQLNKVRQPLTQAAQMRFRLAQKALDDAIYTDVADETAIETKMKEVQVSQAELTKIKTFTEFSIRKILNPEQLVKFREMRQKLIKLKPINEVIKNNRRFPDQNRKLNNRQSQ